MILMGLNYVINFRLKAQLNIMRIGKICTEVKEGANIVFFFLEVTESGYSLSPSDSDVP